jgi:hypothetical protein
LILEQNDPVAQLQFSFLQTGYPELIRIAGIDQSGNGFIEIAMFNFQQFKPQLQLFIAHTHYGSISPLAPVQQFCNLASIDGSCRNQDNKAVNPDRQQILAAAA